MMSAIENQIEAFVSGTASEYAFPGLSVEERKLVKSTAEKLGLSSRSFGMGSERQIHIFKPVSSMTPALEPVKYSVKNTFVDGPVDGWTPAMEQASVSPAHQSMPVGALQEHITAEAKSFATTAHTKVYDSPRNSEIDTNSTKDSDSELQEPPISIKNTFVHFENDSEENADPRMIQSMPGSTFAEHIEAERAVNAGSQKGRPLPLSEDSQMETEGSSAMLFPSTPNAENQMSFGAGEGVPGTQWTPSTPTAPESITVLAPAFWAPPAAVLDNEISQAAVPATYFTPGTPVVLQGLASQPDFNGLHGVVSAFDAKCGRYNVMIEIGPNAIRRLVKVKFQNLLLAQPSLLPQPHCCPPAQPPKASLVLDQMV